MKPKDIHEFAVKHNIKEMKMKFTNEIVRYIYLDDSEFQLFHEGDCPSNYIMEE